MEMQAAPDLLSAMPAIALGRRQFLALIGYGGRDKFRPPKREHDEIHQEDATIP